MNKIEKQKANVDKLLELIKKNPTLRIMPMVETDVVASDDFSWWMADWGKASIEEVYIADERVYIRSKDEDTLMEELIWVDEFIEGLSEEEAIKKAENVVNNYKWEKVISIEIRV